MYRFLIRPKWLAFTALVLTAAVVMFNLSAWQFRRLDERRAFNALVESRLDEAPVALASLSGDTPTDREWRAVTATGRYEGDTEQIPTSGGYRLVTPFVSDGLTAYLERGTIGSAAAVPPAPPGVVEITARFRTAPTAAQSVPTDGLFLGVVSSAPEESALTPPQMPTLDEGPHLSYAFQWLIFAVCVLIGWVLAVRRSARNQADPQNEDGSSQPKKLSKHTAVPWQDEPAR